MTAALHVLAAALYLAAGTAGAGGTSSAAGEVPGGEATIPLDQLLPLLSQKAPAKAEAPPPLDAVVSRAELKGKLTTDAVQVDAHFEVKVLASGRWTRVPLLGVSPETVLSSDPKVGNEVVVAIHGGELLLLAHEPGAYPVDVTLTARAAPGSGRRTAALKVAPGGPPVPLQLEVDPAFTLVEPAAAGEPSVAVYPRAGEWSVAWTVAAPKAAAKVAQRPALEPKITRARAVWVSTLEGKLGLRALYTLRLNRAEKISVEPPPGYRLERAAVNGRAVPLPEAGGALEVEVAPPNPGDTEAKLELALAEELGVFHLSGNVRLELPRASWPIAEVSAEAYLPAVFNYRRQGGSLEQVLDGAEAWGAAFGTPFAEGEVLPGKVLRFRQYLVASSSPDVALGYSVDIAKSYFQ